MFIPIGLDENEVRRTPWLTWGLIASNILVFVVMWAAQRGSDARGRLDEQWRSVSTFLSSHPYLEVPPELQSRLDEDDRQRLDRLRRDAAGAGSRPPDWEVARQQKELDDMVRKLFAT